MNSKALYCGIRNKANFLNRMQPNDKALPLCGKVGNLRIRTITMKRPVI